MIHILFECRSSHTENGEEPEKIQRTTMEEKAEKKVLELQKDISKRSNE